MHSLVKCFGGFPSSCLLLSYTCDACCCPTLVMPVAVLHLWCLLLSYTCDAYCCPTLVMPVAVLHLWCLVSYTCNACCCPTRVIPLLSYTCNACCPTIVMTVAVLHVCCLLQTNTCDACCCPTLVMPVGCPTLVMPVAVLHLWCLLLNYKYDACCRPTSVMPVAYLQVWCLLQTYKCDACFSSLCFLGNHGCAEIQAIWCSGYIVSTVDIKLKTKYSFYWKAIISLKIVTWSRCEGQKVPVITIYQSFSNFNSHSSFNLDFLFEEVIFFPYWSALILLIYWHILSAHPNIPWRSF